MPAGFNLEPGDRVLIDDVEHTMDRMIAPLRDGDPDDIQFVNRSGRMSQFTESEFIALYNEGKIRILTRTERITDRAPEEDKATARAHRRLKYASAYDATPVSKSEKSLKAFIQKVAVRIGDAHPPSTGSVRRWIRTRGEPGVRKLREMTERLRPAKGSRLHPFVRQTLDVELERYWDNPRVTAKEIWARVVTKIEQQNANTLLSSELRIPTVAYSTVWRHCQTKLNYERARRRYGSKEAARRFKSLQGSLEAACLLDLAIMDHTELDCWVIDDVTYQPIGRPRVTFLIDSCSRYPLGFSLSWMSAGLEGAMACLRHALPKKTRLQEKYPDVEHDWLAYGQPREILVDQGLEFVGTSFEDCCADLGISIRIAPVRTPEYKGQIERFLGTLNRQAFHRLQGSVPGKPEQLKSLGIDPEKDAIYFLSELEALIHKWVVDVYAREPHRTLNAAPAQVWQARRKTDPIELCPDLSALNATCSKVVKRVLTRSGIELNNLTYRSTAVTDLLEDLVPRARKRNTSLHGVSVKVKYQPEDLGQVYVWNEVTGQYVCLPCTNRSYADGLSEHHHKKIRQWANETNRAFNSQAEMCRARVDLYNLMDSVVADRVRDRKRLQRLRHPERHIAADRVKFTSKNPHQKGPLSDNEGVEVLIDPLRNRVDGDRLHHRRLLNRKSAARRSTAGPNAGPGPARPEPNGKSSAQLATYDFAAEIEAARAEAARSDG